MKKVLITGAAGYIASSVIDNLLAKGFQVVGLDNNFKNTCDTLLPFITHPNFQFISGDVTDIDDVLRAYDTNPDFVLHAAALVGYPICTKYKELAKLVNIQGTKNVLEANTRSVPLIFCSTGSIYKPGQAMCDESAAIDPPSIYGYTKQIGEELTLAKRNTIVLRFGTAMGISKNNIRVNLLANDLTYQSYLNRTITIFESTFLRSFIHVRDIAAAIVFTFENFPYMVAEYSKGLRIYNVSNNDINITKGELCEAIKAKLGTHVCYAEVGSDLDRRDYRMICDKMYATGWEPTVTLDETLEELIKVSPLLSTYEKYK